MGLTTQDVVRHLKELDRDYPFVITGVERDTIRGHFLGPIRDPDVLAQRLYGFCPDIVDQGVGEVEALAEQLGGTRPKLFLWWD